MSSPRRPSDALPTVRHVLVADLTDGQDLDQVLLVSAVERRTRRDGTEYLRLTFADRSGSLTAMVWDGVVEARELCLPGHPVRVLGRHDVHPRYGAQVTIRALRPAAEGSYALADLAPGPPRPVERLELELRELVATVRDPHLRELLEAVLGPGAESWAAFRVAPAAKHYHQAYVHGLLEHTLTVAQAVSAISQTFGGVDRDIAITGALLHDIGKLDEYTREDPLHIEMTDVGRLQGHIPLGYYRVRRLIEDVPGFPEQTAAAVLHIVLSHHGCLEYGSPVLPQTREATLVHFVDNLGGRLGSFDRLERGLADGEQWAHHDRALGGGAYFGFSATEPLRPPPVQVPGEEPQITVHRAA